MFLRSIVLLISLAVLVISVREKKKPTKEELFQNGRLDIALKSRNHTLESVQQGDCPDGWVDGSPVGLGCVLADMRDVNVNETTAEMVCSKFGEDGRLVEIYK